MEAQYCADLYPIITISIDNCVRDTIGHMYIQHDEILGYEIIKEPEPYCMRWEDEIHYYGCYRKGYDYMNTSTYIEFLVNAMDGMSDSELFAAANFLEDILVARRAESCYVSCFDTIQEARERIGSEDWVAFDKDRSRAQKRRDDYLKTARRTRMANDIFGLRYGKKGEGKTNGHLRDCLPDGHTERLTKGKNAESKRRRQRNKRECIDSYNQCIEDACQELKEFLEWFDYEYEWDY